MTLQTFSVYTQFYIYVIILYTLYLYLVQYQEDTSRSVSTHHFSGCMVSHCRHVSVPGKAANLLCVFPFMQNPSHLTPLVTRCVGVFPNPAGCPTVWLHSDTIYLEIPLVKGSDPQDCPCLISDANWESRLSPNSWPIGDKSEVLVTLPPGPLTC